MRLNKSVSNQDQSTSENQKLWCHTGCTVNKQTKKKPLHWQRKRTVINISVLHLLGYILVRFLLWLCFQPHCWLTETVSTCANVWHHRSGLHQGGSAKCWTLTDGAVLALIDIKHSTAANQMYVPAGLFYTCSVQGFFRRRGHRLQSVSRMMTLRFKHTSVLLFWTFLSLSFTFSSLQRAILV